MCNVCLYENRSNQYLILILNMYKYAYYNILYTSLEPLVLVYNTNNNIVNYVLSLITNCSYLFRAPAALCARLTNVPAVRTFVVTRRTRCVFIRQDVPPTCAGIDVPRRSAFTSDKYRGIYGLIGCFTFHSECISNT